MKVKECTVCQFQNLQESSGKLILVDVREADEYAELSAPCAVNYPLSQLNVDQVLKDLAIEADNSQSLYLICRSGRRSELAARMFMEKGFDQVINVAGGMMKWKELGLPTKG